MFEFHARKRQKCQCPSVERPESEFSPYPAALLVGASSLWVRLQISPLIDGTCPHARGDHLNAGAVSKLITRRASDARSLSAQLRCRGSEYEANYLSGCLLLLSLPPSLLQAAKGDVVFFFVRARSAAHNLQRIRGCTKKRKKIKWRAEEKMEKMYIRWSFQVLEFLGVSSRLSLPPHLQTRRMCWQPLSAAL